MTEAKKKTIALDKSLKIDKAQRNMFVAVCLASIAVGVTLVLVIYFSKVISFNSHVIEEKSKTIVGFKASQENISSLKNSVDDLTKNENLESVARKRSNNCIASSDNDKNVVSEEEKMKREEARKADYLNLSRTCTSLRVMPDALPATLNGNAMMSNVMYLIINSNEGFGTHTESIELSNDEEYNDDDSETNLTNAIHPISATLEFKDSPSKVKGALSMIENSIRNFDITRLEISWDSEDGVPDYTFAYDTYYSDKVNLELRKRMVCAKADNEKCTAAGGDTVGNEYGVVEAADATEEEGVEE